MASEHVICFIIVIILCVKYNIASTNNLKVPRLLVISFDGFRWDYLNLVNLKTESAKSVIPNFDYFIQNGVTIDNGGILNEFTTESFPNHYTLVTGLYQENHGVVGNKMFDPVLNKSSNLTNPTEQGAFWFNNGTNTPFQGAEPIWITNQKHNNSTSPRASGVYFWPGSNVEIQGRKPKYSFPYNESIPFKSRVDKVVEWLANGKTNLALMYFHEPDFTGHKFGPKSSKLHEVILELDSLVGYLKNKLTQNSLLDDVNIILTSDHGMTDSNPMNIINITSFVSVRDFEFSGEGASLHIFPKPGKLSDVYKSLKRLDHLSVYLKEDIPRELHYTFNRRIGQILLIADPGWQIVVNDADHRSYYGNHGYSPTYKDMHPIFIAFGPSFKSGMKIKQFKSVDLYPLMCHILDIKPAQNDGSLDNVREMLSLAEETQNTGLPGELICVITLTIICYTLVFTMLTYAFILCWSRHKHLTRSLEEEVPINESSGM